MPHKLNSLHIDFYEDVRVLSMGVEDNHTSPDCPLDDLPLENDSATRELKAPQNTEPGTPQSLNRVVKRVVSAIGSVHLTIPRWRLRVSA